MTSEGNKLDIVNVEKEMSELDSTLSCELLIV